MAAKKRVMSKEKAEQRTLKWASTDVFYLRRSLAHVQRKLDRVAELLPRLTVEAPNLTTAELIARMRQRKRELIKEIAAAQRKNKKRHRTGPIPRPLGPELGTPTVEPWLDWTPPGGRQTICRYPSGDTSEARIIPPPNDQVSNYRKSWLNHGSEASYGVDQRNFDQYATFLFEAELDDDASWHRDDNPDWIEWGTEVGYTTGADVFLRKCDAVVTIEVWIRVISEFNNAADDGGSGYHSVAFVHTNPDGNFDPAPVDPSVIQDIVLELSNTGHYDSGWLKYSVSFDVKAGATAGLSVLFITHLSAQDGITSTSGQWLTSPRAHYGFSPAG